LQAYSNTFAAIQKDPTARAPCIIAFIKIGVFAGGGVRSGT
jgi:hypothetical protein